MTDYISLAASVATFIKELGISDPYVALILVAMFMLVFLMCGNNWYTMKHIKASNKETINAQKQTIALLEEHYKISVDQYLECRKGTVALQKRIDGLQNLIVDKFAASLKG